MSTNERSITSHNLLLLFIAFFGILVYGLLTALPGSVLPDLERYRFLPNDAKAGTFLLINAVGAVISYSVSGPLTDRLGKKFTLWVGSVLVVSSMLGFGLVVTYVQADVALILVFACSLVLGLGANAIVSAGHALVADIAEAQRNAALNLLDVCFGAGLAILPQIAKRLPHDAGLGTIFWILAIFSVALLVMVVIPKFPKPTHPESFPTSEVRELFESASFWLVAIALFMYVGTEVAVGKWVVTFIEKDARLLGAAGIDAHSLQQMAQNSPDALTDFFKNSQAGIDLHSYALGTLSLFGLALVIGRLFSSFLLGVMRVRSLALLVAGSFLTTSGLAVAFNASTPSAVRWAILASGIGMGPIFPTSVGLASVIVPRISGTAMSWVMGIGFSGLLVIPPSVGYISEAVGGRVGDVRKGLFAVLTASAIMLLLHIILAVRERQRGSQQPAAVEPEVTARVES